jgi:peptide/nickel transport system permease protein
MSTEKLMLAQEAIQQGDKVRARSLLRSIILEYPRNEQAWLFLARVVEKREQEIDCLEHVMRINPHNQTAARALAALKHEPKPPMPDTSAKLAVSAPIPQPRESTAPVKTADVERLQAQPQLARGEARREVQPIPESAKDLQHPRRKVNWSLYFGILIVALIVVVAAIGPSIAPRDPLEENVIIKVGDTWETPPFMAFSVPGFLLGSDQFGRDMLSRILWGVRPTLVMVSIVSVVRLMMGTVIGLGAGWFNNRLGRGLETAISAALAVPVLMVGLGAIALLGAELGLLAFIIGLSINGWGETARLVREQTRTIKTQLYIEAAHALGASQFRILARHVLRQIMPMIWMLFAFEISNTLMVTAGLGFLGYYIGGDVWIEVGDFVSRRVSGAPELGQMLATTWTALTQPWPMVLTGSVVFLAVLGFNLLGEGLRLRLNPERASRNSLLDQAMRRFSWWLEEKITYPASSWVQAYPLRSAVLVFGLLGVGIGAYWGWSTFMQPLFVSQANLSIPGEHLWANRRGDPYGTLWTTTGEPIQPQILWTSQYPAGLAGGLAIAKEGTLYLTVNDNRLLSLSPEGKQLWEASLLARPVGSPAIGADGTIYVGDDSRGLTAVSTTGEILWQYQVESTIGKPNQGPVIAPSGMVYLLLPDPRGDQLLALTPEGQLIFSVPTNTKNAGSLIRFSPDGEMVFVKSSVLDAAIGEVIDLETPTAQDPVLSGREQYFVGADGKLYLQTGHNVFEWRPGANGFEIVRQVEWNYRSLGMNMYSSFPVDAGATSDSIIWLLYSSQYGGTMVVWLSPEGNLLGATRTSLIHRTQMVGLDQNNQAYLCGMDTPTQENIRILCQAFAPGSETPIWEYPFSDQVAFVNGGAIVEGRLYITLENGTLIAIGGPTP